MLKLRCAAQNYDWGRAASESEVAQLALANGSEIDTTKQFAELWMGTHPNCPSRLEDGTDLRDFLKAHPQLVGERVAAHFGADLPYLFKVLSVRKALSIQSHPDKALAGRLHAQHPKLYPDPNHKPEMALALSDFEALCSFLELSQLQAHLRLVPELASCVGQEATAALLAATERDPKALRAAFTSLMTCAPEAVTVAVRSLVARLQLQQQQQAPAANGAQGGEAAAAAPQEQLPAERVELALRLHGQFPDDIGVLSSFFLNVLRLPNGSAIYLPANEPHAYLAGELVECMAASDNVIRAGLTPKFKDTAVLCESLTYTQGLPDVLTGSPMGPPGATLYRPPFEEFEIQRLQLRDPADAAGADGAAPLELDLPPSEGPRLLLVQRGGAAASVPGGLPAGLATVPELSMALELRRGMVVLVPAGVALRLEAAAGGLVTWVAAVNGLFFQLQEAVEAAPAVAPAVAVAAA